MSTVAAPIESTVSVLCGAENPTALVDWISSFLKTLEKFNGVVDKLATVCVTLCPAILFMLIRCLDPSLHTSNVDYPLVHFQGLAAALRLSRNLINGWQIIIGQVNLDVSVCALLSRMKEVYTFLTTAGLHDITSMKAVVERITHQTVQCSYFIQAYCANQKFRKLDLSKTLMLINLSISFKERGCSRTCSPPKPRRSCKTITTSLTSFCKSSATGLRAIR